MSPDGAKFWLNLFRQKMFPLPTFSTSFHGEFSFPINGFWSSLGDGSNNLVNKILFFYRFWDGGDGGNWCKVDLIWVGFLQHNTGGFLHGAILGEPSSEVGGLLVITGSEVRAVVPPHRLGGEGELELFMGIDVKESGDGVLLGLVGGVWIVVD